MNWRVPLSDLSLGHEEKQAVLHVLDSGWLAMGEVTGNFEKEFANFAGVKHAIAVTNGTASLHLACLALNIQPGDEVIVPSLTFVATVNAIAYVGATPIFADVMSEDDLTISPEAIERNITGHTKAIMCMHYGGYMCDMPAVMDIAKRHHLKVIEDAAHAPGASLTGIPAGSWGDIASFSFFPNKNMTTAEGGMLVTNQDELAEMMRNLRSHGMTTLTWDRHRGHAWSYDVVNLGYNYRIDEVRSAIGLERLKKLPANNELREKRTEYYRACIDASDLDLKIPFKHQPGVSSNHILPLLLPKNTNRVYLTQAMKDRGIQTSLHYPPVHLFSYYRKNMPTAQGSLPVTEEIAAREVTLPLYPSMSEADIEDVVDALKESVIQVRESVNHSDKP